MARRGYPPEFRQRVVELVEGGRKVSEVAAEFQVSEQTIYTWRPQGLPDSSPPGQEIFPEKSVLSSS